METSELAARIRNARKARGWGQKELAAAVGVSTGTIGNLERGLNATHPETLRAIFRVLDIEEVAGDDIAAETREGWPSDVRVFLDIMGLFLTAMPEDERQAIMHDVTRSIVNR